MLYQCSSSRIARIPFTTSHLLRTTAERLRARDRTPLIGQSDVDLTVLTKLDNTHWLPSERACPLVNPPLKHLMYATLIIIVYIYIYIYIYIIIYMYVYIYIGSVRFYVSHRYLFSVLSTCIRNTNATTVLELDNN